MKKNERQNPCTGANVSLKRMRMNEVQSLNTSGYAVQGGRARFLGDETRMEVLETSSTKNRSTNPSPPKRSARPKDNLNEDIFFNEEKFDKYLNLVKLCTDTFETSESSDVLAEGPSMIAKMRGLLDPLVKFEVDYDEAIKDVSNVAFMWRMNAAQERGILSLFQI